MHQQIDSNKVDHTGCYRTRIRRNGKTEWTRVKRCTLCGEEVRMTSGQSMHCYEQHYNSPRCQKAAIKLLHAANSNEQGVYFLPEERGGEVVMLRCKQCAICHKHIGLGIGTKFTAYEMHLKSAQCNMPPGSQIAISTEGRLSVFFKDGSQLSHPYTKSDEQSTTSSIAGAQTKNVDEGEGSISTEETQRPESGLKRKLAMGDKEGRTPIQKKTRTDPEVNHTTSPYFTV